MSIQRVPDVPFAQIANSALRDNRLSFRARGILAMVLSNVGEWEAGRDWIVSMSDNDGITAVQTALNELTELGYRKVVKNKDEAGRFNTVVEWAHYPQDDPVNDQSDRPSENLTVGKTNGRKRQRSIEHHPQNTITEHNKDIAPANAVAQKAALDVITPNAGHIMADWIDRQGQRPPERVIGQLARETRKLLDEGFAPVQVTAALDSITAKGLHPSTLASELHTMGAGRKKSTAEMCLEIANSP